MLLPLKGLIVLEFSQYLSGPSAGLRLADLGARVIKIERPGGGDPCRKLSIKNLWVGEDALNFHAINRNKESFTADLKNPDDLDLVKKLIGKADVLTHNFRPGVMEKIGLSYTDVQKINERIVYAEITGYGKKGPWKSKPGQDLLIQSLSGLAYTTGDHGDGPMPFGLSVVDSICGIHTVQGILAALIRRQKTGLGAYVELSLLESAISLQFELFTTHYHSKQGIKRSAVSNGNPLLGAPYGIYKTADGHIALAMMSIPQLREVLFIAELEQYSQADVFAKRDEIKSIIAAKLLTQNNAYWLERLKAAGLWASEINDWNALRKTDLYKSVQMENSVVVNSEESYLTTRCPIKINGRRLFSNKPAPLLGQHTQKIKEELL
ncbi:CaiB/BaiF CoA transferase family protein [Niabella hibiscisoli]|uniref:CaiB/BaiF CoA transferase family protein n=1 Tax=Niabella hibiscisoli TaxID=1825928 RepID=UPI001F1128A6|nr:CaiB/BaiF CoA-transferase family protein [Niabella hibiscisoli]MCH5720314.1 CoA transferase [Niabella hibiscisoli]